MFRQSGRVPPPDSCPSACGHVPVRLRYRNAQPVPGNCGSESHRTGCWTAWPFCSCQGSAAVQHRRRSQKRGHGSSASSRFSCRRRLPHRCSSCRAKRQQTNKRHFPGNRVLDGNGISGPIYLHGISRLVLDAHGRFCNACPAAVPLAKLSTHVRPFARLLTLRAVFFPQQRQGHARPCQFAVDVRIVGLSILTGCFVPVWKEKLFQIGIGDIVGEGPGYALFLCCLQYISHRMSGTVCH